eukprot:Gb_07268 [translate_table: standard]
MNHLLISQIHPGIFSHFLILTVIPKSLAALPTTEVPASGRGDISFVKLLSIDGIPHCLVSVMFGIPFPCLTFQLSAFNSSVNSHSSRKISLQLPLLSGMLALGLSVSTLCQLPSVRLTLVIFVPSVMSVDLSLTLLRFVLLPTTLLCSYAGFDIPVLSSTGLQPLNEVAQSCISPTIFHFPSWATAQS